MTTYENEQFPIPTPWRLARELRLRRPPWWMVAILLIAIVATWIPLALIYRARTTKSRLPRVHFFHDMDHQPKFGPQDSHAWFLDGRAMRPRIDGTIARGRLQHDQHYDLGYLTEDGTPSGKVTQFVSTLPPQLDGQSDAFVARGQQRYNIYCTVCHGVQGAGDGPVNQRALELQDPKWVPATNLMTQMVRDRADGQLFQAITDGVRNMPSYGAQIPTRDRWAIVAYVRKLQSNLPIAPEPTPPSNTGATTATLPTDGNPSQQQ